MEEITKLINKVDRLYESRKQYLESSKKNGTRLMGYLCSFVPPELITAAGLLPVRITGDPSLESAKAAEYIEPNLCPYIRNCFEVIIEKRYEVLDGITLSAACDAVERIYGILSFYRNVDFLHFIHVPHTVTESSLSFYKQELEIFVKKMESSFNIAIDNDRIWDAIKIYNKNKKLIKKLYKFRNSCDSILTSTDMAKLLILGMTLSAKDYNSLLKELCNVLMPLSTDKALELRPRILLMGCITDNISLAGLIEDCGGTLAVDDTCIGTKTYFNLAEGSDPFEALANAYFKYFLCPRTYREPHGNEFDYLLNLIENFRVDGVVVHYLRFCDPHGFDYPSIQDVLREHQIPILRIEDDYRLANLETLKTRIEAFVESLG